MSLLDLYNKVSAKPAQERRDLLKARYGTSRPKDVTRPKLGPIPDLLRDEVTIQGEWHIDAELVEAMRAAAMWKREALELHIINTECKCCGNTATHSQGVFVRFRHKGDKTAIRRINKDYRADPTDFLLPRETFQFVAFTQFCSTCFNSPEAEIQAWERQLSPSAPTIEQQFARNRAILEDATQQSLAEPQTLLAEKLSELKLHALFGVTSDDAAFEQIVSTSPRLEPSAEDVGEGEDHYVELCPRCGAQDVHLSASEVKTCETCGWVSDE